MQWSGHSGNRDSCAREEDCGRGSLRNRGHMSFSSARGTSVRNVGFERLRIAQPPIGPGGVVDLTGEWRTTRGDDIIVGIVTKIGNDVRADRIPVRGYIRDLY